MECEHDDHLFRALRLQGTKELNRVHTYIHIHSKLCIVDLPRLLSITECRAGALVNAFGFPGFSQFILYIMLPCLLLPRCAVFDERVTSNVPVSCNHTTSIRTPLDYFTSVPFLVVYPVWLSANIICSVTLLVQLIKHTNRAHRIPKSQYAVTRPHPAHIVT